METVKEIFNIIEPSIWSAVGALLLWLIYKGLAKAKTDEHLSLVYDALRQGVDKAQEDFVTWRKRASEDGKLTAEERKEAMDIAYRHAKAVLTGPAFILLMSWGWEKVQSVIKQFVEKKKSAGTKIYVETSNVNNDSANRAAAPAQGVSGNGGGSVN